jgi:hypothetical protein
MGIIQSIEGLNRRKMERKGNLLSLLELEKRMTMIGKGR